MRKALRRLIPSMYLRRLWLLLIGAAAVAGVLTLQLWRLTVVQGETRRARAEAPLTDWALIPTSRGAIRDARDRILAEDRPSYDVAVRFDVITGRWADDHAERAARAATGERWAELSPNARQALIDEHRVVYQQQLDALWAELCLVGDIDRAELEDRKATIIRRVQRMASHLWRVHQRAREAELDEEVSLADVAFKLREHNQAHELLVNVDDAARMRVRQRIHVAEEATRRRDADGRRVRNGLAPWLEVQVRPSRARVYPLDELDVAVDLSRLPGPLRGEGTRTVRVRGVGSHLIGAMRPVGKEQIEARPLRRDPGPNGEPADLAGYLDGDRYGHRGVEATQERWLRGSRGVEIRHLDSETSERAAPEPGRDVRLSLDIMLQARIRAVMDPSIGLMVSQPWHASELTWPEGKPLNGAAVVLDVARGEVLAAVSMPARLRPVLGEREDSDHAAAAEEPTFVDGIPLEITDADLPWLNRTVAKPYQPGSTVKPLVLVAATTEGLIGAGETITCHGPLDPARPHQLRCWIFKRYMTSHGPLAGPEAIARSCNVYFFTLGRDLGPQRIVRWYQRLGLDRPTQCGLPEEIGGFLPDLSRAGVPNQPGFGPQDATQMGIGQGPIAWTPMQAANAYATLARGGYAMSPTLVTVGEPVERAVSEDLALAPDGVAMAMQGLDEAVNETYGSGHHITFADGVREKTFDIEGVKLYGKTGTADPGSHTWIDLNNDKQRQSNEVRYWGDHAWCIVMAQKPTSHRPDYVVVVVVDHAGSGGRVSGPIANQILHAMRDEGYL